MRALGAVFVNELERILRHRWGVLAAAYGLMLGVVAIGYGTYVVRAHDWRPPKATQQTSVQRAAHLQSEIVSVQASIDQQRASADQAPAQFRTQIQASLKSERALIDTDRFLLAHLDVASPADSATASVTVVLFGFFVFVFVLAFGWMASELLAGERSSRTMSLVLSRPVTRSQLLAGKLAAVIIVSALSLALALVVALVTVDSFLKVFDLGRPLYVVIDDSRALSDANTVMMPTWAFVAMCYGVTVLALVAVVSLGVAFSSFCARASVALGITIAVLFVGPVATSIIGGIATAFGGRQPDWLNYILFSNLTPVSKVPLGNFAGGGGGGMHGLEQSAVSLVVWAVGLIVGSWLIFRGKAETA